MGSPLDWLIARPIAHRGLHDAALGLIENSLGAARAAIEAGYAIECDVQRTADGEAVVFHDFSLDRLTAEHGPVSARDAAALQSIAYRTGDDRIATLETLLTTIGGQMPLVCEIKSRFDGDMRLADRVAALAAAYPGPLAIKSFDPAIVAHLKDCVTCPRGVVAEAAYDHPEWADLSAGRKTELAEFLHFERSRPDFLSYHVNDLPHAVPHLLRKGLGLPVVTWTVRRPDQLERARLWADQIVFEGFRP